MKTVCPLEPQGSSSSKQIKVPEAAALDVKLEKAHKQLQKETMEQLEKARKASGFFPHKTPRDADADGSLKHQVCHLIIGDCDTGCFFCFRCA